MAEQKDIIEVRQGYETLYKLLRNFESSFLHAGDTT
jgi:hypothetical protein